MENNGFGCLFWFVFLLLHQYSCLQNRDIGHSHSAQLLIRQYGYSHTESMTELTFDANIMFNKPCKPSNINPNVIFILIIMMRQIR